jgi:hypothetical protein
LKDNHKKGYISNVNCEEKISRSRENWKLKLTAVNSKQTQRYLRTNGLKPTFQNCIAYSPMSLMF